MEGPYYFILYLVNGLFVCVFVVNFAPFERKCVRMRTCYTIAKCKRWVEHFNFETDCSVERQPKEIEWGHASRTNIAHSHTLIPISSKYEKGSIISATFDYHWIETKIYLCRISHTSEKKAPYEARERQQQQWKWNGDDSKMFFNVRKTPIGRPFNMPFNQQYITIFVCGFVCAVAVAICHTRKC